MILKILSTVKSFDIHDDFLMMSITYINELLTTIIANAYLFIMGVLRRTLTSTRENK